VISTPYDIILYAIYSLHFATKIALNEDDPQKLMPPGLERSLLDKPAQQGTQKY
jgi:hypothetical protein